MDSRHIVFVCTGNICRSPIAEYMLRNRMGEDSEWTVSSASVMLGMGMPVSAHAVQVMDEEGVDMHKHRSMPLSPDLIDLASVIVVMTGAHAEQIEHSFPEAREKVFLLTSFDENAVDRDIADPIGASIDVYRNVRDDISKAMPGLIAFLRELG
jgi:glycine hydroxymethyltransferase